MRRHEIPNWTPLALLGVVLVLLYAPLLIGERFLFWGLPALQFYPWREYAFQEISAGRMPYLNPYNGAGAPLIANYQSAVFYPPNWLHLILPDAYAMSLLAVLHIFWAGLGMWNLMRLLRVNELGLAVSTLTYALASYGIGRMGSFPTANVVAWLPWLMWGIMALVDKRRVLYVGLLGLITAMMLLAGHAQTAFYGFVMGGLLTLWAVIGYERVRRARWQSLLMIGGGVLLGAGIAALQLLLTAELLLQSQRSGGVTYETLTNLSLAPLRSVNLLLPNFFGSPVDGSYLTPDKGIYFEDAIYIGVLPLFAAVAALIGWLQRRKFMEHWISFRSVPLWAGIALLGFVLALGRHGPFYEFLYDYVPTFDNFREPVRWMILPVFALSVLAGIGVQSWGRSPRLFFWTRLAGAAGAGMVAMALVSQHMIETEVKAIPVLIGAFVAFGSWSAGAALLTLAQPDETWDVPRLRWQMAVLILIVADLGWAAQGLNPTAGRNFYRSGAVSEPPGRLYWFEDYEETLKYDVFFDPADYRRATQRIAGIRHSLLPNLNMLDQVEVYNTFDPLQPQYYVQYQVLIESSGRDADPLLRAAGIGQTYGAMQPDGWLPVGSDDPSFISPEAPSQVRIVPDAIWFADDAAVRDALTAPNWSPDQTVILTGDQPATIPESLTEIRFFEVLEDAPHQKRYRVVLDGGGYLVLAQTWYPGWSVIVNGEEQPLYRANLAFMAVELPPGGGEIIFRYTPTVGLPGAIISFLALSITLGLIAFDLIRQTGFD